MPREYCCELQCLRCPRALVDGLLRCGCYYWCTCACRSRNRNSCPCLIITDTKSTIRTRSQKNEAEIDSYESDIREPKFIRRELVYKLSPCGHLFCSKCILMYSLCRMCNVKIQSYYLLNHQ